MIRIFSILSILLLIGCAATIPNQPPPQELVIHVDSNQPIEHMNIEKPEGDSVSRSMEVRNPEGQLSSFTFLSNGKAFMKIFSGLSVMDATNVWNDIVVLRETTDIREIQLFINSPGGSAFAGLALADIMERAQREDGFSFLAHASGIIASAAVPVYAICNKRFAAPGTIFMVHEASIFKFFAQESASDIRSQNTLMELLGDRYVRKLTEHTNLTKEKWQQLERETTWFNAEKAQEYGLVDKIE